MSFGEHTYSLLWDKSPGMESWVSDDTHLPLVFMSKGFPKACTTCTPTGSCVKFSFAPRLCQDAVFQASFELSFSVQLSPNLIPHLRLLLSVAGALSLPTDQLAVGSLYTRLRTPPWLDLQDLMFAGRLSSMLCTTP